MKVDLTLAVNYLPACFCLCKALVLTLALALIPSGEEVCEGYIILAAMLYLDRVIMRNMIFDANAILIAIYFANVHAVVRASTHRLAYSAFVWGLHLCWAGMCLTLLADPAQVRWIWEKRAQASKIIPVAFMLCVLIGTSCVNAPLEAGSTRACRALTFTMLAFVWIYTVGIHSPHGIEYLKETSCQFVARLAPILYSPVLVALMFTPAAVAALVWFYSKQNQIVPVPELQSVTVDPSPKQEQDSSEEVQLQELFKQAKMARMESIPE